MGLNKITQGHGYELNSSFKSIIGHNTLYIELRDEGGLIWPSRIAVIMASVIINFFELFLYESELNSNYCISCSSTRVDLLMFKEMMHEII